MCFVIIQDVAAEPGSAPPGGLPSIPLLLALALTNAALAFGAMYLAAGRAEAAVASILAGGQPLVLALAGWTLFGERSSGRTVTRLAVATIGVVLVATTSSGATSLDGVILALFAAIATGDRPAAVELAGIAAVLVGLGIVSVAGASPRPGGAVRPTA